MSESKIRIRWTKGKEKEGQLELNFPVILKNRRLVNAALKKLRQPELREWIVIDNVNKRITVEQASTLLLEMRDFFANHPETLPFSDLLQDDLAAAIKALRKLPNKSTLQVIVDDSKPDRQASKRLRGEQRQRQEKPTKRAKTRPATTTVAPHRHSNSSAGLKLSKVVLAEVKRAMEIPGADRTLEQFIGDQLACQTIESAQMVVSKRHPEWNHRWVKLHVHYSHIADSLVTWQRRGTARRIAFGDLSEYVRFLQMHVRCAVLAHRPESPDWADEFIDVWPLLLAIGIGDRLVVDRYQEQATYPIQCGHPGTRALYNGVHAILRRDQDGMDAIAAAKPAKSPAWLAGLINALRGIVREDPCLVASGLDEHLQGYSKRGHDPLERALSVEALGLVRLAEQQSPDLVSDFDFDRGPPWDAPLFVWTLTHEPDLEARHLVQCPKEISEALLTLRRPTWID